MGVQLHWEMFNHNFSGKVFTWKTKREADMEIQCEVRMCMWKCLKIMSDQNEMLQGT